MNDGAYSPADRKAHVILDTESRVQKARKIVNLLGENRIRSARRILEIGCGSGVIASALAALGEGRIEVHAVDVEDNRTETDNYRFHLVGSAALPFDDGHFDIVVSNYVIEHVGTPEEQAIHLREIERVLSEAGVAYLGIPNKWRLVEPHYRLPFLSWFPQSLSDRYVRWSGRGTHYDCIPLSLGHAQDLLAGAKLDSRNITLAALRETLAVEKPDSAVARLINNFAPDWLLALGLPIMPVYIFLLSKQQA
ncbi:class I SAM-dependent methyltransferase [Luteimonas sp. SX5]|uniref:Class I SAM-dependent methyltransferase n=1 Tax=Luteimonas galliterrae TaxID=2940486 RepID=A0ABT0MK35_9GAMM|nr:class I SAM-dependent methyltransferase [Luteimonas galliterrae]MCL1634630.1 class I SAM-dependent methyltransferase [Luteimonas galliterrae]